MACAAVPSLLFCCLLLLVPHFGSSYHTSYTVGGNHVVLRSPDRASPTTTFCSTDNPSGDDGGITAPLRVFHRLSPCCPHAGTQNQGKPSAAEVLRRDALGLSSLLSVESGSASDAVTVPTTGSPYVNYSSAYEYHVDVGYGTPLQRLTVGFDMLSFGMSVLACKPCSAGEPCDKSFDPSESSSLAQIPCNSLDCPLTSYCFGKPNCESSISRNGSVWFNMTVVTDKLTLSESTSMDKFRFTCLEMGPRSSRTVDGTPYGVLDLSKESHSLASRAPQSPDTVAFSYCLPSFIGTQGFLSIAAARPELSNRSVSYTALRTNPARPNQYFVQLTGITVGRKNIPIPAAGFAGNTLVALRTTFTYLRPDIYAALREEFVGQMKSLNNFNLTVAAPVGVLDTCYNFTDLASFSGPSITFNFDGGVSLFLEVEQMYYLQEPHNVFSVACLAFAAAPTPEPGTVPLIAIIGTSAQTNTEVAYDLRGGKVGFAPHACPGPV